MKTVKQANFPFISINNKWGLLALPFLLLGSMFVVFRAFISLLGPKIGWLSGMITYWLFWCIWVPVKILGWDGVKRLFTETGWSLGERKWSGLLLIILPPLLAVGFGPFSSRLSIVTPLVFVLSLIISGINAFCEELLWRGVYTEAFPDRFFFGVLFPAVGFGIWHLAPIAHHLTFQGILSFVGGGFFIGLCWGFFVWKTKSIKLAIISHMILDFSGFLPALF